MDQRKSSPSPSTTRGSIIQNALLLSGLVFLLVSCGSTVSSKKVTTPLTVPPPSLFILSPHGDIDAYRADGTHLWQDSAIAPTGDIVPPVGTHMIVTSQMVYTATNTVQVYTHTGQLRWQHDLSAMTDEMLLVGQILYIAGDGGSITAWDATTGALQWQQSNLVPQRVTVLAHDAHNLFVGSQTGGQVIALNLQSGTQAWSIQGHLDETVQALSIEGDIMLIRTDGSLTAVQASTGKMLWHRESQVQTLYLDPTTGIIYTAYIDVPENNSPTSSGIRALRLSTGDQLWNVSFPLLNGENVAISSTGIVWASATSITSWGLDGKQRWQVPYVGQLVAQVISIDVGHVFLFISRDGTMTALDTQNGHQRWQQSGGEGTIQIQSALIWIINTGIGDIRALTFTGVTRWTLTLSTSISDAIVM